MKTSVCLSCLGFGGCQSFSMRVVTDAELSRPDFIRAVINFGWSSGITRSIDGIVDAYRDVPFGFVDAHGQKIDLNIEILEEMGEEPLRTYLRYRFRHVDEAQRVFIHPARRQHFRVIATILRATAFTAARRRQRGLTSAANDNWPILSAANDNNFSLAPTGRPRDPDCPI